MIHRIRSFLTALFFTKGFRSSVLTLLSGASMAIMLANLASPILTRLYTPSEFGVAEFFLALITVIAPIASLRYEDALMQPPTDEEAAPVIGLSVVLLGVSVVLSGLFVLFRYEIADFFGEPALAPWLWLVPISLVFFRLGKLTEFWLTRLKRFRPISAGQVTHTSTMVSFRIGAGLPVFNLGPGD